MIKYKVIKADNIQTLEININTYLFDEWELVGGVSYDSNWGAYIQAIIKRYD